jgi:hypothetical protein
VLTRNHRHISLVHRDEDMQVRDVHVRHDDVRFLGKNSAPQDSEVRYLPGELLLAVGFLQTTLYRFDRGWIQFLFARQPRPVKAAP